MNIAILGFDAQGRSSYDYWNRPGNSITICDRNPDVRLPEGAGSQLGDRYLRDLDRFDLLVRTPGLHPSDIVSANSAAILKKVTSNTNEFMAVCPSRNIIGVTGTKGKGTTCSLVARMLAAAGKTVHLGGNIGVPPLDLLRGAGRIDAASKDRNARAQDARAAKSGNQAAAGRAGAIQPDDWVVLELANFQLIDLKTSPLIAVCLMVVPEHLNWHADMIEYVTAKQQLFVWQTFDDIAIYYHGNEYSQTVAEAGNGAKVPYFAPPGAMVQDDRIVIGALAPETGGQEICRLDELKLLGEHNWQNVCAAVTAAWQVTHNVAALHSVLTSFAGLPHRLERVRELDKVSYFDDSFAATPDAAVAALQAIKGSKVLILGGFDRQLPLENLAGALAEYAPEIRRALLIGASAQRLAAACRAAGFDNFEVSPATAMPAIVAAARQAAKPGDSVVLSPGFASFDMFKDFEDRGRQFQAAVHTLR